MAQKLSYWLLAALILSLGFGQLLRIEYLGATFYLHDLLVISCLCLSVLNFVRNYKVQNFVTIPGFKLILLGLAVGWVSALLQYPITQLLLPSLYTLRLLAYLTLYLLLIGRKILIPNTYFIIAGLTTLAIGLAQYFLLPDMRVFQYLGWDDHLNRLTLPHYDPTFTAVMLGLLLLKVASPHAPYSILHTLYIVPAVLLTYSRSIWLSLAMTLSYCMLLNRKLNVLMIGICVLIIPILFLPKKFGEGTNLLRTYSIESRLVHDATVLRQMGWRLLTGVGYNTLASMELPEKDRPNHAQGLNNSYLQILATSGVIGLWGWLLFLRHLYMCSAHQAEILFIAIASLFNNVLLYPFVLLWLLLINNVSSDKE